MSDDTPPSTDPWPCPHCLEPLTFEGTHEVEPLVDEHDGDLLLDLPPGWVCTNPDCPSKHSGYHPDEGAKQRVLMLFQATRGESSPGSSHGG